LRNDAKRNSRHPYNILSISADDEVDEVEFAFRSQLAYEEQAK
jgi:hypothetical protein